MDGYQIGQRCYLTISAPGESSENPTAGFPENLNLQHLMTSFQKRY